jgi:hypothetical protein
VISRTALKAALADVLWIGLGFVALLLIAEVFA